MNEKFEKAFKAQIGAVYFDQKELQYSASANVLLTPYEYSQYLLFKEKKLEDGDEHFVDLPLNVFNSKHIYYCFGGELSSFISSYLRLILDDVVSNNSFLSNRFASSLYRSRVYSEIEGSLNVENVPTTRRRLKELIEDNAKPENTNDVIIKNMDNAIKFVESKPVFNKDNLFKLYSLLSKDCLDEDSALREGDYYRYDTVEVGGYKGCPYQQISDCMDSLFAFVDERLKNKSNQVDLMLLPHICHYYLLYIHPYFDYNGRMARMISYWVYLLTDLSYFPPIISEAINQKKDKYYRALEETRNSHNDISYFLIYIFKTSCEYFLCYRNIELVDQHAKNIGILLTETEKNYIKKILITYQGAFSYNDFLNNCNIDMSKQGALKILNKLVSCGALKEVPSSSKTKLFDINEKIVDYTVKGK